MCLKSELDAAGYQSLADSIHTQIFNKPRLGSYLLGLQAELLCCDGPDLIEDPLFSEQAVFHCRLVPARATSCAPGLRLSFSRRKTRLRFDFAIL